MSIIMMCGFQGSGKSTYVKQNYCSRVKDVLVLSNDIHLEKSQSLLKEFEELLKNKNEKTIILDNTYLTKKNRKEVLDICVKYGKQLDIIWIDQSIENCIISVLQRQVEKHKMIFLEGRCSSLQTQSLKDDPHIFPVAVLFRSRKIFEEPSLSEGSIHRIIKVKGINPLLKYKEYPNKAIFFDIDGTLRKTDHLPNKYPLNPEEVVLYKDESIMKSKIQSYREQGFLFFGISNQSGIEKGIITEEQCKKCMEKTKELLEFPELKIQWCSHKSFPINCYCRKPQSGLGIYFIEKYKVNPYESIMVGDLTTDKTFGERLGIKFINVDNFFTPMKI